MLHTYVATLLSSRPTTMQNIDSINTNINIDVFEIAIVKKKKEKKMFNFTKFFYQMTFEQKNIFLKVTRKIDLS